jgi:hypothetical protein
MSVWEISITQTASGGATASVEQIATINVSQIDSQWANMNENYTWNYGVVYDQADGNLIFSIMSANTGGSANSSYLVKIDAANGNIMWKIAFPQAFSISNQSRIIGWLGLAGAGGLGTYPVWTVDTIAGIATKYVSGSSWGIAANRFIFDSITGSMICEGTWAGNSGLTYPLAPVGQTPAGGFGFGAWFRWQPGTLFFGSTTSVSRGSIPAVIGYTYTTQGQVLRALEPQKAGAANGPALAKTRRNHMFGAILKDTQGISFGTDLTGTYGTLHMAQFKSGAGHGVTPLTNLQLYSGIYWDTLDDTYSFDGMPCWQVTRPYPATVCALGGFLQTQDR